VCFLNLGARPVHWTRGHDGNTDVGQSFAENIDAERINWKCISTHKRHNSQAFLFFYDDLVPGEGQCWHCHMKALLYAD